MSETSPAAGDHGEFPLKQHLGMSIAPGEPGDGRATARVELDERHLNPNGVAHGAVLFAMVDTAMGKATMEVLPEGSRCASIEVQLRFLRPVTSGPIDAEVAVLKRGRTVVFLDGRVHDAAGTLVATASGTFAVIGP